MTGVSILMASLQQNNELHYSAMQRRRLWRQERLPGAENSAPAGMARLVRGGSRRAGLGFVGARTVKARNGNAEQAVIHGKLRAMMNMVVHDHAANTCRARHVKNLLAASEQLPILHHFRVAYAGQRCASVRDILVKHREQFLSIGVFRRLISWPTDRRIIQFLGLDRHWQPFHHRRHMTSKPAAGAGLFVRLPVPFFIGTAFQDFTSVLHLLIKLSEHHLSNRHDFLRGGIRDSGTPILGEQKANCQGLFYLSGAPSCNSLSLPCLVARTRFFGDSGLARPRALSAGLDSSLKRKKMALWHTNFPHRTEKILSVFFSMTRNWRSGRWPSARTRGSSRSLMPSPIP